MIGSRGRHPAAPAIAVTAVSLTLLTAMGVSAFRLPPWRALRGGAPAGELDYASEPQFAIPGLQLSYLQATLGGRDAELLLATASTDIRSPRDAAGGARAGPAPPAPPRDGAGGAPGVPPILTAREWDLRVSLRADRSTVPAGGDIRYVITVRNVGNGPFLGTFRVEAHTPFRTAFVRMDPNPCEGDPDPNCQHEEAPVPVPGPPTDEPHIPNFSFTISNEGDFLPGAEFVLGYIVRVYPGVSPGTQLVNHAHVTVTAPPRPRVTTEPVTVVVQ